MYDIVKEIVPPEVLAFIEQGDVMTPIDCGKYDCAMSIETAEHILPSYNDIFVDNVTKAATKLIVFTAAPPGQGGTGHINLQKQTYWIDKFYNKNWIFDEQKTEETKYIWMELLDKKQRYLYKNLVIFSKI